MKEEQVQEQKPKLTKKQLRRLQAIEHIQRTSLETPTSNRVSRALTFQQAFSILLRSQELIEESEEITQAEKARQIDACWRLRRGR